MRFEEMFMFNMASNLQVGFEAVVWGLGLGVRGLDLWIFGFRN